MFIDDAVKIFGDAAGDKTGDIHPLKPEKDSLLSAEDWSFIREISDRFPERSPPIYDRFIEFERKQAALRPLHAFIGLHEIPREGLKQRGFEDSQSVFRHTINMETIIKSAYKSGRLDDYLENARQLTGKKPADTIREALYKAKLHDSTETLITDFTPSDSSRISKPEKNKLEHLAGLIIFESFPERLKMLEEYETKSRPADEIVKMADLIEWPTDYVACTSEEGLKNLLEAKGFKDDFPDVVDRTIENMKQFPQLYDIWGRPFLDDLDVTYHMLLSDIEREYPEMDERRSAVRGLCNCEPPAFQA